MLRCRLTRSDELEMGIYNNKNIADVQQSLMLYGNGDGGGGPTPEHIEKVGDSLRHAHIPARATKLPCQEGPECPIHQDWKTCGLL